MTLARKPGGQEAVAKLRTIHSSKTSILVFLKPGSNYPIFDYLILSQLGIRSISANARPSSLLNTHQIKLGPFQDPMSSLTDQTRPYTIKPGFSVELLFYNRNLTICLLISFSQPMKLRINFQNVIKDLYFGTNKSFCRLTFHVSGLSKQRGSVEYSNLIYSHDKGP